MSLFRPRKPFMSTFRISYFPHSLHGRLLASSPRPMFFARKTIAFRPQDLWFWSPRALSERAKTYAFGAQQRLPTGRRTPSDGSKGCGFGEQGFFQISYFVVNYLLVSQFFITFAGVNIIESWNVLYLTRRR